MELIRSTMKHASRFGSGTFLSRMCALLRDVLMASILGTSDQAASFFLAFRFSNIMRRMLGEGAMQAALIPIFEELRAHSEESAARFFRATWVATSLVLCGVILGGELCLSVGAYLSQGTQRGETLLLTMIMLPGLLFVCWYGIQAALCTCYGNFFLPAAAPAAFNVVWISALLALQHESPASIVLVLASSIVFAYALQWSAVLPTTLRHLQRVLGKGWWRVNWSSLAGARRLVQPLTLGLIGVSATQLNSLVDALFAQIADPSGPAYLWYAVRLEQVPVGLIGVALSSAMLPPLARCLRAGRVREFGELVSSSLVRAGQATMLCSALFLVGGYSLIELVFCRGAWTPYATGQSAYCLWAYAIGLTIQTWVVMITPAFYAAQDYRTPSIAAIWALGSNALFNGVLVYGFGCGPVSIALATGWASLFNLWWLLKGRRGLLQRGVLLALARFTLPVGVGIATGLAAGLFWGSPTLPILFGTHQDWTMTPLFIRLARLASEVTAFGLGYLAAGGMRQWRAVLEAPVDHEAVPLTP